MKCGYGITNLSMIISKFVLLIIMQYFLCLTWHYSSHLQKVQMPNHTLALGRAEPHRLPSAQRFFGNIEMQLQQVCEMLPQKCTDASLRLSCLQVAKEKKRMVLWSSRQIYACFDLKGRNQDVVCRHRDFYQDMLVHL